MQGHSGFSWSKRRWGVSGISWTTCRSFPPCSRQTITPAPLHSIFLCAGAQLTMSKHQKHSCKQCFIITFSATICLCSTQVINEVKSLRASPTTASINEVGGWRNGRIKELMHMIATDSRWHRQFSICMSPLNQMLYQQQAITAHNTHNTHNRFTALWILFGTTRVSWYQKKHSPTHTYRGHQSSVICFLHLLRSMASL